MTIQETSLNPLHELIAHHPTEFLLLNRFAKIDLNDEASRLSENYEYYSMILTASKVVQLGAGIAALVLLPICAAPTYAVCFLSFYGTLIYPKISEINGNFRGLAQINLQEFNRTREIITKINEYEMPTTDYQMMIKLFQLNLDPMRIQHKDTLRLADSEIPLRALVPLIARYQQWNETANKSQDDAIEYFRLARAKEETLVQKCLALQTAEPDDLPALQTEITKLDHDKRQYRDWAYKYEELNWLPQKIHAAYQLSLIGNINWQENESDVGHIVKHRSPLIRAENLAHREANAYFVFKDQTKGSVDREWIKHATIPQIAKRIFDTQAVIASAA